MFEHILAQVADSVAPQAGALAETVTPAREAVEGIVTVADLKAVLPSIVLFATGTVVLLIDAFRRTLLQGRMGPGQYGVHFLSLLGTTIAAAFLYLELRSPSSANTDASAKIFWSGALRLDAFGGAVGLMILLGAFLSLLAGIDYLRRHRSEHGEFHCLVLWAAGALILFAQSNNLILAFLSLETLSMAVYILTAFLRDSRRSVEGALKYFVLGGFSSGFLLFGFALIYGATRQIEFGPIVQALHGGSADTSLLIAGLALSLVGLAFKIGAFPFCSWVPDAYEGAPAVTTGFMAVTVKIAGFAVLLRVFVQFEGGAGYESIQAAVQPVLALICGATMVFGNVVAVVQSSVKRMLAYSAIGHTGYLLLGIVTALSPEHREAATGSILFYLLPYSLMTIGAFTLLGYLDRRGEDRETFEDYRGLSEERPVIAFLLLLILLSFAAIPPTAGFWAKLYLFREAVSAGHWVLALIGILTSIVSMYFYLRLVVSFYMRSPVEEFTLPANDSRVASGAVILIAALAVVALGLFPEPILEITAISARALGF